ncbi:hypothetical protein [Novosphingobium olei]|uniref:Uncharacterized protein n=1 Tax=Novosphingobium olei TaxID=2728851 RepID=A0A7Y0BNE8_9SPHN|nr:hypothetical protein [Novosphingobium olei]NML93559.1 hypothetical protein [Novosphingobium olei]BEV00218.1 hypothetical protein NSDW_13120 [Novosphingobium olei]
MLLSTLALAFAAPVSPAGAALACNPSGPRPQHCGSALAVFDKPGAGTKTAEATPRKFCHPDPSKNRGCTRPDPHAEALALRKAAVTKEEVR